MSREWRLGRQQKTLLSGTLWRLFLTWWNRLCRWCLADCKTILHSSPRCQIFYSSQQWRVPLSRSRVRSAQRDLEWLRFGSAIMKLCSVGSRLNFLSDGRCTEFVLGTHFLEVDFIELIVFLEYFADVVTPDLLHVEIEVLDIQSLYELPKDCYSFLKLSGVFGVQEGLKCLFERKEAVHSEFAECFREIWRLEFWKLCLLHLAGDLVDSLSDCFTDLLLLGFWQSLFFTFQACQNLPDLSCCFSDRMHQQYDSQVGHQGAICGTLKELYDMMWVEQALRDNCMNREINQSTMLGKAVSSILLLVGRIVGYIPALIYEYIYSEYFTKATYRLIGERSKDKKLSAVLDVGTATGHPLLSIVHNFGNAHVVGIDINNSYLAACTKLFQPYPNVEIKQLNYYEIERAYPGKKFDLIIFGSSFMLMPDQIKAINLAKDKLTPNGKMYFLLTLYDQKNWFNRIMGLVKPYLKYLSTVDFGQVTYKHEFESFLGEHELEATLQSRCQGNFFLKYFKFYIYEVRRMGA